MLTEWEKEYWESRIKLSDLMSDITYESEVTIIELSSDEPFFKGKVKNYFELHRNEDKFKIYDIKCIDGELTITVI